MSYKRKTKNFSITQSTFGLNITSMTDMFTILLVFLLQTYSTAEVQLTPEKGINIPSSSSNSNPVKGVKISLSNTELKVNESTLLTLDNGQFLTKDLDKSDNLMIPSLYQKLTTLVESEKKNNDKNEGRVLLMADKTIPYQILQKILFTSSSAGYPQIKLITLAGE